MSKPPSPVLDERHYQDDIPFLLALDQAPGMGCRSLLKLLEAFGTAAAIWEAPVAELTPHLRPPTLEGLLSVRQKLTPHALQERYAGLGIHLLPRQHPQYPPLLRHIYDPPVLLYVRGNPALLAHPNPIAVVGTRRISDYGCQVTDKLIADWAPHPICVVSGLARGVDGVAHQAALRQGLPTVAVFGCGIDVIYPRAHEGLAQQILAADGALVSEYPLGVGGSKFSFPQRNRIVAGMSRGVLVVEGSLKSGSLITARLALEENRAVYAVPGNLFNPGSEGPHHLIQSGALAVTRGDEILRDLGLVSADLLAPQAPPEPQDGLPVKSSPAMTETPALAPPDLGPHVAAVWPHLTADAISLESLQARCGLEAAAFSEALTLLELEGLIASLPGAKVRRCPSR